MPRKTKESDDNIKNLNSSSSTKEKNKNTENVKVTSKTNLPKTSTNNVKSRVTSSNKSTAKSKSKENFDDKTDIVIPKTKSTSSQASKNNKKNISTKENTEDSVNTLKEHFFKTIEALAKIVKKVIKEDESIIVPTEIQIHSISKKQNSTSKTKSSTNSKKKEMSSTKKNTKSTSKKKLSDKLSFSPEYYDLPYKYNKTVVKILAQTPSNLFIYWEISDEDRENLKKQFGTYFFEITKPVLFIQNKTLNYAFEVDINDFANSWYVHVNDSNSEYVVELARRPIPINYNYIPQYDISKDGPIKPVEIPYIHISSSNKLLSPNDHILFNKQDKIYFMNIKNNNIIEKNIKDFPYINKNSSFVSIYELYQNLYKKELENSSFNLINHSFINPSSLGISSKFK